MLGGARSGKSRHAEKLARATGVERVYLATAQAFDDEMRERIARHREDRAEDGWTTIEEPLDLPTALAQTAGSSRVVLVDCLTLWLSNIMLGERNVTAMQTALAQKDYPKFKWCLTSLRILQNERQCGSPEPKLPSQTFSNEPLPPLWLYRSVVLASTPPP